MVVTFVPDIMFKSCVGNLDIQEVEKQGFSPKFSTKCSSWENIEMITTSGNSATKGVSFDVKGKWQQKFLNLLQNFYICFTSGDILT